jgi:cyclophilin family peptidyl-prolyl cis-trans isomerase
LAASANRESTLAQRSGSVRPACATVAMARTSDPHSATNQFYINVVDEKGTVTNWNLELASPNVLVRQGWTRQSLKIGDEISVTG